MWDKKRIALISSGPPISLKVLYCLKRLGSFVDFIDVGRASVAKYSRYKTRYVNLSTNINGHSDVGAALVDYLYSSGIDAVVPGDIGATGLLHSIQEHLSHLVVFPVSGKRTLDMLDNKWSFNKFLFENNICTPRAQILYPAENCTSIDYTEFEYPCVLKPLYGESGQGIHYVPGPDRLLAILRSLHSQEQSPLLLQKYAEGIDADISVLAKDGRIHAHVLQLRDEPGVLKFAENPRALELASAIVASSNYTGVANIDLRIDTRNNNIRVLECNPRFWYTLQASLWRGLNFVSAGLAVAQDAHDATTDIIDNGNYYYHGHMAKRMLPIPTKWKSISHYNWRGFFQAATDPLPFMVSEYKKHMAR